MAWVTVVFDTVSGTYFDVTNAKIIIVNDDTFPDLLESTQRAIVDYYGIPLRGHLNLN